MPIRQYSGDTKNEKIWLAGVWIFLVLHLLDTYRILWDNFHYDWYRVMLAEMGDWQVCVRYVLSLSLRIMILWAVAGVLTRRDQYRKLLRWLCAFRLCIVFIHHQYPSFVYISSYLSLNNEDFRQSFLWFGHWYYPGTVARMIDAWLEELLLAFLTALYFIHPKVKRLFR